MQVAFMMFRAGSLVAFYAPLALAVGISIAIPTVSEAQAPGVVYSCYVPKTGTVYRIKASDTPAACVKPDHVEFSWNIQGIQGAQGPAGATGLAGARGPQGDPGEAGAAGAAGISGFVYIRSDPLIIYPNSQMPNGVTQGLAFCPEGKVALGGGLRIEGLAPGYFVLWNAQIDGSQNGWFVKVLNTTENQNFMHVYVQCANVS